LIRGEGTRYQVRETARSRGRAYWQAIDHLYRQKSLNLGRRIHVDS
jgi:hypothetical protein